MGEMGLNRGDPEVRDGAKCDVGFGELCEDEGRGHWGEAGRCEVHYW